MYLPKRDENAKGWARGENHIIMSTVALFIIGKNWKQPKHLSINEWINWDVSKQWNIVQWLEEINY